jgi:Flp pilus assembly protein CpaB
LDSRPPKTFTIEVEERHAETFFVAMQLGKLHFALRPLERSRIALAEDIRPREPVWAAEVSPAIRQISRGRMRAVSTEPAPPADPPSFSTGSSLERLIRRAPPASAK